MSAAPWRTLEPACVSDKPLPGDAEEREMESTAGWERRPRSEAPGKMKGDEKKKVTF